MAIVFDSSAGSPLQEYGTTTTFAHTVTASGSGKILTVGTSCTYTEGRWVSDIDYGGEALTKNYRYNWYTNRYLELWYLVNPPTGANNIVVTYTGNTYDVCVSTSYTGVDPDNPFGTLTYAKHAGSYTIAAPAVASAPGELVIDVATSYRAVAPTINAGAGQTERRKQYDANMDHWMGRSDEAGAASVDMTWSKIGDDEEWGILAVPLKPEVLGPARLIKYWANTLDPKRRIFDNTGRIIPASLVEYNNWLRNEGPYFMTPKKHTSLIEADSIGYLEAIKFNEDGRTQYITETETLLENLFRRLGARGA